MQQLLARHLLQHHYVVLPGMGTLRLVLSPAEQKEEVLSTPQYLFAQRADESLLEQQLQTLSGVAQQSEAQLRSHLEQHTQQLMAQVQGADVLWKGVGTWTHSSNHYSLRPPQHLGGHVLLPQLQLQSKAGIAQRTDDEPVLEPEVADVQPRSNLWLAWLALGLLVLGLLAYFVLKGGRWTNTGSGYRSAWLSSVQP